MTVANESGCYSITAVVLVVVVVHDQGILTIPVHSCGFSNILELNGWVPAAAAT